MLLVNSLQETGLETFETVVSPNLTCSLSVFRGQFGEGVEGRDGGWELRAGVLQIMYSCFYINILHYCWFHYPC